MARGRPPKKSPSRTLFAEIEGSHTSSNPPDDCCGKRKTTVLNKGEETQSSYLSKTSSAEDTPKSTAYKTISATTKVKVGKAFLTISRPFLCQKRLIPLLPRPLGTPLWQFPPLPALPSPFSTTQRCSHPR